MEFKRIFYCCLLNERIEKDGFDMRYFCWFIPDWKYMRTRDFDLHIFIFLTRNWAITSAIAIVNAIVVAAEQSFECLPNTFFEHCRIHLHANHCHLKFKRWNNNARNDAQIIVLQRTFFFSLFYQWNEIGRWKNSY